MKILSKHNDCVRTSTVFRHFVDIFAVVVAAAASATVAPSAAAAVAVAVCVAVAAQLNVLFAASVIVCFCCVFFSPCFA